VEKGHKFVDFAGRCIGIPNDSGAPKYAEDCVGKYEYMPDETWKGSGTCTYTYKGGDKTASVLADPEKFQQIVLNLLTNAVKFTDTGGSITLSARPKGNCVEISVADTGAGISPEKLDRIFDPFVQAERRLNQPVQGVGLGLAISRDLARAMGGDLTVVSVVGQGSTFTLKLPKGSA